MAAAPAKEADVAATARAPRPSLCRRLPLPFAHNATPGNLSQPIYNRPTYNWPGRRWAYHATVHMMPPGPGDEGFDELSPAWLTVRPGGQVGHGQEPRATAYFPAG